MADSLFKKYYKRVAKEGIIKSLFCGLIVGFSALALCGALSWFFGFKEGLWISLAVFVAVSAGVTPLFYFKRFRPTTKAIAMRVDELGLEERYLTMTELENDDSYIALKQREDTIKALSVVDHMLLKVVISASLCVAVAATAVVGLGMATVDTLHYAGVIPSGMSLLEKTVFVSVENYTVTYTAAEGGEVFLWSEVPEDLADIDRETSESIAQLVETGEGAEAVIAVAQDNWVFVGWSDGIFTPYRQDTNVTGDVVYIAMFEKLDDADADEPKEGDPNSSTDSDESSQLPAPSDGSPSENPGGGGGGGDGAGGGRDAESNQIIDGNTYYGDEYGDAHSDAMDRLGQDTSMSDDMKGWVSDYFDSIEKGGSGNSGEGSEGGN